MAKPKFVLEIIQENKITAEVDKKIRSLLCHCFPNSKGYFSKKRSWNDVAPAYSLLFEENKKIHGHVGVILRTIQAVEEKIKIAGIQSLAVFKTLRGTGLAKELMVEAMEVALSKGIEFGLLFCVPELEKYYKKLGWKTVSEPVIMLDPHGNKVSIPSKNICMVIALKKKKPFPKGPIDIKGRDW